MPFSNRFNSTIISGVSGFLRVGGQVVMGGDNVSPLVEIGLTDLPKSGGEIAPTAPLHLRPWNT